MTSLREDGADALEWAARYLEGVGDLPVLAQVEPGYVRSRLPASAPEQGEPFSAVLRDVDEILLPAMTHWQSPRFFGYFAISSSEPAILAELLAATLNQNAILWRTSPASCAAPRDRAGVDDRGRRPPHVGGSSARGGRPVTCLARTWRTSVTHTSHNPRYA